MTALATLIRDEISHAGPIPFRRFMELALYQPEHGYYVQGRDPFGAAGDFFTNSQLQPVFGRLLARQIGCWYEEMGRPAEFTVVEVGAGRGETIGVVRRVLPQIRCLALEGGSGRLPDRFQGVIYSNEFFDALPVHLVQQRDDALVELYVDTAPAGFRWRAGPVSSESIFTYQRRYAPELEEGQKIEVNLEAIDQIEKMAASLDRGYILTIDYGYTRETLAAGGRFAGGSLMSYANHHADPDVLADPGGRDITSHVNFTALEQRGAQLGLDASVLQTQTQFLMALGQTDEFASALAAESEHEQVQLRMQLKSLLFGLGETFQVLVQKK